MVNMCNHPLGNNIEFQRSFALFRRFGFSSARRVNGILKQEYFLSHEFRDFKQAHRAVKEAVRLYNNRRLHRSLKLCTPEEIHRIAA